MTAARSLQRRCATRSPFRPRLEYLEDRDVPATFNVTTTLDVADPADGKRSLREAITAANNLAGADVIVLPAGVCKIALIGAGEDANATGDFDITGAVTIQGAGSGATVIDGQQLDRVFDVLGSTPGSIKVILQGLTVRSAKVTGDGGGVRFGNADLVVRDAAVTGNRASAAGGGISNLSAPATGNLKLVRTTVARNVTDQNGGGINLSGSLLTVKDSTVRRNIARNGGGIDASNTTLTNSSVSGNTALVSGGGIDAGTLTVTNSTVSGNATGGSGGGIEAGTLTVTNSSVSDNTAGGSGGGILIGGLGTATLTNCTVSGNAATSFTSQGGGIVAFGTTTLTNCTVVENSAHTGGGLFRSGTVIFSVRNTIVALNLVDFTGTGPNVTGDFSSGGHNLIGDGTGGTGFGVNFDIVGTATSPIDPKLGPLANNGGLTKTMALQAGSPAIDHGDNVGAPATDQRGFARKKDGNGDGVAVVDIGAFEK